MAASMADICARPPAEECLAAPSSKPPTAPPPPPSALQRPPELLRRQLHELMSALEGVMPAELAERFVSKVPRLGRVVQHPAEVAARLAGNRRHVCAGRCVCG